MILASQSPRRIELMREAGYNIRVIPADIDETPFDGEAPLTLVERLARAKAAAVAAVDAEPNELTVAADTIVTFDGQILGKPANEDEARTMLRELSGRTHQVATGVCIVKAGDATAPHAAESLSFVDVTDVTFYEAFRVPLSHSSYFFAPILQPVIIAFACASAAPTQYEKLAICIAYERAVTFIPSVSIWFIKRTINVIATL